MADLAEYDLSLVPAPLRGPTECALRALRLAVTSEDRLADAVVIVQGLFDDYRWGGIQVALGAWAAAYRDHLTAGDPPGVIAATVVHVRYRGDEAQVVAPGQVSGATVWAGALLSAYSTADLGAWRRLLGQAPADGWERGAYVGAVLESVAEAMRRFPRGVGRMSWGVVDGKVRVSTQPS